MNREGESKMYCYHEYVFELLFMIEDFFVGGEGGVKLNESGRQKLGW